MKWQTIPASEADDPCTDSKEIKLNVISGGRPVATSRTRDSAPLPISTIIFDRLSFFSDNGRRNGHRRRQLHPARQRPCSTTHSDTSFIIKVRRSTKQRRAGCRAQSTHPLYAGTLSPPPAPSPSPSPSLILRAVALALLDLQKAENPAFGHLLGFGVGYGFAFGCRCG